MFRPYFWPSSGRCVTKNRPEKLFEPRHKCKIPNFKMYYIKIKKKKRYNFCDKFKCVKNFVCGFYVVYHIEVKVM